MGRQLNFWMTQSDELAFVDRLMQDDAVWTPRALPYGNSPALRELVDWQADDTEQNIIVVRRNDWDALDYEHIKNKPPYDTWTQVGTGASPCFEFSTCKRGSNFIARGRIYFDSDWLDGKQVLIKPEEPTRWFDRLVGWLRRRGTKGKYKREYIMPDAERARANGDIEINRDV